jgi:hypothetical protein
MIIRPERKAWIQAFTFRRNRATALLLAALFLMGLTIAWRGMNLWGVAAYFLLWVASYGVIFAGACRYCAYYGKNCPIPLEGGLVHRFFVKKDTGFGFAQLAWATLAYGLRVAVPVLIIIREGLYGWGAAYAGILVLFWIIHLRYIGCPNCINTACPLNPGKSA